MRSASVTLDGWYWPSHMPITSLSTLGSSARQSYSDRNLVRPYREVPTFLGLPGDRRDKFLGRRATPDWARAVCRVGLAGLLGVGCGGRANAAPPDDHESLNDSARGWGSALSGAWGSALAGAWGSAMTRAWGSALPGAWGSAPSGPWGSALPGAGDLLCPGLGDLLRPGLGDLLCPGLGDLLRPGLGDLLCPGAWGSAPSILSAAR